MTDVTCTYTRVERRLAMFDQSPVTQTVKNRAICNFFLDLRYVAYFAKIRTFVKYTSESFSYQISNTFELLNEKSRLNVEVSNWLNF